MLVRIRLTQLAGKGVLLEARGFHHIPPLISGVVALDALEALPQGLHRPVEALLTLLLLWLELVDFTALFIANLILVAVLMAL